MLRASIAAALLAGGLAAPALAQDAPVNLGGFRLEGLVTYEGNKGRNIGYGIGAGYDVQSGGMVFGIEAEGVRPGDRECATDTAGRLCLRSKHDLYVGGRIGAAIGANSLAYAKAGYTNLRFETDFDPAVGAGFTATDTADGVRVGGGLQLGLGPNIYGKAEYRYSNYEKGLDKHTGVVGVGFRF